MSSVAASDALQIAASKVDAHASTISMQAETTQPAMSLVRDSIKDAGRVHIGGGMMRF